MTIKINKKIVGYSVKTEEETPVNEEVAPPTTTEPQSTSSVETVSPPHPKKQKRPEILFGPTLKIKANGYNLYVTINCDDDGRPLEIFFNSSHLESYEWVALATRLSSMILRSDDPKIANMNTLAEEFIKTESPNQIFGRVFGNKKGKTYNGVIQLIGYNLMSVSRKGLLCMEAVAKANEEFDSEESKPQKASLGVCDKCGSDNLQLMDGCPTCRDCGDSKCG